MSVANLLEEALGKCGDDVDSKRAVLDALMRSRVTVLLDRPWDGRTLPSTEMQMLFVTDGGNTEQPMLALFSSDSRAGEFIPDAGVHRHPVSVDAAWALLGVPAGAGIMLNPNQIPNFRIGVEVVNVLREAAQKQLDQRIHKAAQNRGQK